MKKVKINKIGILVLFACIVTAFSFLKSSAVSSQKNEVRTNPNTEYQITYELNGGRFEGEYPKTFKISQETAIPNPIKERSEFLGWTINDKTDAEPVKDYKIPSMTQEDIKLTANWKSSGNMLLSGSDFAYKIQIIPNFSSVKEIKFVYGTPNPSGEDVSEAQDGSIKAHIEGNILAVTSEGEIMANPDSSYMFNILTHITNITFTNFNTSQVTDMSSMFSICSSLTNLDLSKWDTSQVTNIGAMFGDCHFLTEIKGLNNFNTSKVTDMSNMFGGCSSLVNLDLSKWDTSKANVGWMFADCNKLSGEITIMNPNTEVYEQMFSGCSTDPSAKFIVKYISPETKEMARKLVATKSTNSNVYLYEEPSTLVDGQTFNSTLEGMSGFANVEEIRFVYGTPNSGVDISEAKDGSIKARISRNILYVEANREIFANQDCTQMFNYFGYDYGTNKVLNKIIFSNFNTSKVTDMNSMFYYCRSLTDIVGLENFNTSQVTNMNSMFTCCDFYLIDLNISNWNTSKVTDMGNMFNMCYALKNLNISKWDTSKVTNMSSMFANCRQLTSLDLDNLDTSQVTNMNRMFEGSDLLSGEITIMNPNITAYYDMFRNCSIDTSAKFIVKYVDEATKQKAREMVDTKSSNSNVFLYEPPKPSILSSYFCNLFLSPITGFEDATEIRFVYGTPNPSGEDVSEAGDGSIMAHFEGTVLIVACEGDIIANTDSSNLFNTSSLDKKSLKKIVFENFDTSQATNMTSMFSGCENLTEIVGLEKWNTSKVTDMLDMFNGCSSLTSLDLSSFDTSNVTNMGCMFNYCNKLQTLNLSNWNTTMLDYMSAMFKNCHELREIKGLEKWDLRNAVSMDELFRDCYNLSGEITIANTNAGLYFYSNMFYDCSTEPNTKFVVKYIDENTKGMASDMVATKNSGTKVGNVYLYEETTVNDIPNEEEPSVPDTVVLTIKDGNKTTMKEILTGEIGSLNVPSKEGMIFSGYFYDAEYTKPVSERDIISEDTTIYIKWEEIPQEETEIPQDENKDENLEVA